MKQLSYVAFIGVMLWAGAASAVVTPAQKCEAAKIVAAGTYAKCREVAEHTFVLTGDATKYATAIVKCDTKQQQAWTKLETKYGVACPTSGDQAAVQADVTHLTSCLTGDLGGTPATCDLTTVQGDLNTCTSDLSTCTSNLSTCTSDLSTCTSDLSTCTSDLSTCLGGQLLSQPLQTGQTTAYGPGSDGDLQNGDARSYTVNVDGTITDNKTGLMWEKKDQSGGIHDYSNTYAWSGASYGSTYIMDGTITTTFLAALNAGAGFAGHTDWRIPNMNELQSLVNYQNYGPAVDPLFNTSCAAGCTVDGAGGTTVCSCTSSSSSYYYWSSTTYQYNPALAWYVNFKLGSVFGIGKGVSNYVRAVRGGS